MVILNAIQGVLGVIIMAGIGYFLCYRKMLDPKSSKLFSMLVISVALPAYMISNLMTTYDREKLLHLGKGVLIPFLSMGMCYFLGMLVAKVIKIPSNHFGTFSSMFSLSNTIFVGLPVNLALFGDDSLPFVLLFYIANTTLFWTIGVYGISSDGDVGDRRLFTKSNVKRIFSPPYIGFLVAVILILAGVKLPKLIMDTAKYMGNMTTPLSMIFIGIAIFSARLKDIRPSREMFLLMFGRFILSPLVVIGLCHASDALGFALPLLMKKVFVIQSSMPIMTNTAIVAENYNADSKYAAVMTTASMILSLVMIPAYMILISTTSIL